MIWIVIEDGEIFEGTLEQFQSCFFNDADTIKVFDWCATQAWKCSILNYIPTALPIG